MKSRHAFINVASPPSCSICNTIYNQRGKMTGELIYKNIKAQIRFSCNGNYESVDKYTFSDNKYLRWWYFRVHKDKVATFLVIFLIPSLLFFAWRREKMNQSQLHRAIVSKSERTTTSFAFELFCMFVCVRVCVCVHARSFLLTCEVRRTIRGGGGGGDSDLVPTGVCRWSRQTCTHL